MAAAFMEKNQIPYKEVFVEDPDGRKLAEDHEIMQVPVLFVKEPDGNERIIRDETGGEVMRYLRKL
jgi:hypothetical protein